MAINRQLQDEGLALSLPFCGSSGLFPGCADTESLVQEVSYVDDDAHFQCARNPEVLLGRVTRWTRSSTGPSPSSRWMSTSVPARPSASLGHEAWVSYNIWVRGH